MHKPEVLLGILVRGDVVYPVLAWPGYGVVCPGMLTSNGSAALVARVILAAIDPKRESQPPWDWLPDYADESGTLAEQLVREYKRSTCEK
jgi:hypothetical protein